jgi:hypothetical protein
MSIARVMTTKLTSTIARGSRTVQVGFVETTDIWKRSFLDSNVEEQFKAVAEQHIDSYRPETAAIVLQWVVLPFIPVECEAGRCVSVPLIRSGPVLGPLEGAPAQS